MRTETSGDLTMHRGITLPPLLFLGYLGRSEGEDPFTIAWYRFVDITIGIGAAVIMGSFLWPSHARVKFFSVMSRTLGSLGEYCAYTASSRVIPSYVKGG